VPLQIAEGVNVLVNTGVGFTVIVNVVVVPVQPLYTGVIVIVAVTGFVVGFNEVNEGMLPTPLAARPIDGVSLVQLYCVATPLKLTAVVDAPLHKVWFDTTFTTGTG
jgi:hypothetical protein